MRNIKKYIPVTILIISIIIGVFFRFYKIGQSPAGFYVDEASMGYNAYSLLKTGKDEYGKFLPVMFRSFATFQSPVYTYLTVPFVAIFGLSPISVRLPSAIFGTLTIIVLYFLVRKLLDRGNKNSILPVISAAFLAVSPWHIMYCRTAYETNIALFFLVLGSLLFFHSLKKPWLFLLTAVSFAISFDAYRAEILIVPLLVSTLTIHSLKTLLTDWKYFYLPVLISLILGVSLVIPMILITRTPGFQTRTSTLNIFSFSLQSPWGYKNGNNLPEKLLNTPFILSVKEFVSLYSSYLSPRYMFQLGDSGPRKPYPDMGTFPAWQAPLYFIGLYFLFKEKSLGHLKIFVISLLLISPIPAALTRDPYSTLRSLPLVISQIILISFGIVKLLELIKPALGKLKYLLVIFLIVYSSLWMFISIFYLNDYYRSHYWNYGWKDALNYIPNLDKKLPIVVDTSHGDAYILLLFFLKYDPAQYQKDNFEVPMSEYYTNMSRNVNKHIGRFSVKNFQWGIDTDHIHQYIIADNIAIGEVQIKEHNLAKVYEVRLPSGEIALRILKTNPR